MITAMNDLGYDAVGLGNHEMNFGLEVLDRALQTAEFPVLCTNLSALHRDVPFRAVPSIMLRRRFVDEYGQPHDLSLGVLSVLPPQVMQWDRVHLAGRMQTRGLVQAARDEARRLRAAGADIVIVLNHSGIGSGATGESEENAGLALARLPQVDIVICGHKHRLFPGAHYDGRDDVDAQAATLAGKPAAMPGCWGSHLAVLDLELVCRDRDWTVARHRTELRPIARRVHGRQVPRLADHTPLARKALASHESALARMRHVVSHIDTPLHTYFSQIAPCRVSALVAAAQAWRAAQILDTHSQTTHPVLSAAAPFRCGSTGGPENYTDLGKGPVSFKDIAAIYPFPNTLHVLRVSGAQLVDWLEQAAAQFNRIAPGRPDQDIIDSRFPSYNFDILHGVTYRIDPSQPARFDMNGRLIDPAAHRISDLRLDGRPLSRDAMFDVITNSYRANGGGNFTALAEAETVIETNDTLPDILTAFLQSGHRLPRSDWKVWEFAPMPGFAARFRTGPSAPVQECPGLCPDGMDPDGFARFVLHF